MYSRNLKLWIEVYASLRASKCTKKRLQLKGLVPGAPIECWTIEVAAVGMPDLNCPAVVILAANHGALVWYMRGLIALGYKEITN